MLEKFRQHKTILTWSILISLMFVLPACVPGCDKNEDEPPETTSGGGISPTLEVMALGVEKTGNGEGTVTSDIPGVDCGDDCGQIYDEGTTVVLTAVPTGLSNCSGFTGDCSETGWDDEHHTCTIVMDDHKSISVNFYIQALDNLD